MGMLIKLYRFSVGCVLLLLYNRKLKIHDLFKDKRIAVVGPADSALNSGKGPYIDGFDFVVRINKAPALVKDGIWKKDIGSKTDVLFHSFFENDFSGGGILDLELYDSLGIRYIVNPLPTLFGYRLTLNFFKKYLAKRVIYFTERRLYDAIKAEFGVFRPTTGFFALQATINTDFKELYITGFTFFRTSYVSGYRDPLKESGTARAYIRSMKLHDPELEFGIFKRLLASNTSKNIILDDTLIKIVNET